MSIKKQQGATLITALIMLIALTLLVVSGILTSNTNLRIAGNMQVQEEGVAAAQQAVEKVMNASFAATAATVTYSIDIDNNGSTDYLATVVPTCTASKPLTYKDLDSNNVADKSCTPSAVAGGSGSLIVSASGVVASNTPTWCSAQQWDLTSTVVDTTTGSGSSTTLHQGSFQRVETGTACP